ncbi:hypothetical protein LINPERPRIM_LOCUS8071 [Linum perenne]
MKGAALRYEGEADIMMQLELTVMLILAMADSLRASSLAISMLFGCLLAISTAKVEQLTKLGTLIGMILCKHGEYGIVERSREPNHHVLSCIHRDAEISHSPSMQVPTP